MGLQAAVKGTHTHAGETRLRPRVTYTTSVKAAHLGPTGLKRGEAELGQGCRPQSGRICDTMLSLLKVGSFVAPPVRLFFDRLRTLSLHVQEATCPPPSLSSSSWPASVPPQLD